MRDAVNYQLVQGRPSPIPADAACDSPCDRDRRDVPEAGHAACVPPDYPDTDFDGFLGTPEAEREFAFRNAVEHFAMETGGDL